MSKRSKRLRRREQERRGLRQVVGSVENRFSVLVGAINTPFAAAVATALRDDDSLPLLVYADWCDENGRPAAGELARRVGYGMQGASAACPSCPSVSPAITATVNGVPVEMTGWTLNRIVSKEVPPGVWDVTFEGTYQSPDAEG